MWKRFTSLVIVALCFAATSSAYEPLTEEQAREYVDRFPKAAAEDVIRLDVVEHATPTLDIPRYDVIAADGKVILRPRSPLTIEVGHLAWSVTLPEQRAAYEPNQPSYLAVGLASFAVGAIAALTAALILR